MRFIETDIAYLCVGKGNAGAVDRDPGAPLDPQHQGAHREYHSQHVPSHSNSKYDIELYSILHIGTYMSYF